MTLSQDHDEQATSAVLQDALEVLLRFGGALMRAGDTAFRVREWMSMLARKMAMDNLSVSLTLGGVTAAVRQGAEQAMMMRDIEPPAVNVWRIGALEQLAQTASPTVSAREIATKLLEIETAASLYSSYQTAAMIGGACGAFASLNGGGPLEVIAAGIGGGIGQWLRLILSVRGFNQYSAAALCAAAASGSYALIAVVLSHAGFGSARHAAGFISSTLFLVPGFPLVAAVLDLVEYQTIAALSRFAYSAMILLAAAFGLSVVIALGGFDVALPPPTVEPAIWLKVLLRGIASFVGGCGFAILYNSSIRAVLAVGLLSLGANELRLALHDGGMMLAPATFLAALAVGLIASILHRHLNEPRIAITVPGIIIMVPGLYAFQMIVLFNQGQMLDALQAASLCGFVIGAMAMGLAAARLLYERHIHPEQPHK